MQAKQAKLLEACGFPCEPAGEREFGGRMVAVYRPTGERREAAADLVGFGGAAFGGKTYGLLLLAYVAALLWPGVQITFFRRTYTELKGPEAAMSYAYQIFNDVAQPGDGGKEWHWPNGSRFYFRYCQNEIDVYNYQSQAFGILLIDEATHFTWSITDYILTRNRSGVDLPGFVPFAVLCSNPGNIGHGWYSQLLDVTDRNGKHETAKRVLNPNGKFTSIFFIPAFLEDNQIGVSRDPGYEDRLMQRDPQIARALRYGDWTIFAGQAFPTWTRERIACAPFDIPDWWPKWRALDIGFVHPAAGGWLTMDPDKGRYFVYRALLKSGLTDRRLAVLMKEMTPAGEGITHNYASPDMWNRKNVDDKVTTSADQFAEEGIHLTRADNDRRSGKRKIDRLLVDLPDDRPAIQVFEPYYEIFACMGTLVRSKGDPEDVEKVEGDDAYDMLRYGLSNLKPARKQEPRGRNPMEEAGL